MEVLRRHQYSAFGPGEPKGFKKLRDQYHAQQRKLEQLDARMCVTNGGLEFVMRVKQIGKAPAMTATIYDATAPVAYERVNGPGNPRPRRHAENPDQPGTAMCGARLPKHAVRSGDGQCPLCEAVINAGRDWTTR